MQGILLTQDNRDKILQTSVDIATEDLDGMIAENDKAGSDNCRIFIPDFPSADDLSFTTWATVPPDLFERHFELADMDKMKTEFVEVALKPVKPK